MHKIGDNMSSQIDVFFKDIFYLGEVNHLDLRTWANEY